MTMKLRKYIDRSNQNQSDLAKEIGQQRNKISYWIDKEATVELTDIGIRIRLPSGLIVYETQVDK